jgi:hypothetical protein
MKITVSYTDYANQHALEPKNEQHAAFIFPKDKFKFQLAVSNTAAKVESTFAFVAHGGRINRETSSVSGFTVSPT